MECDRTIRYLFTALNPKNIGISRRARLSSLTVVPHHYALLLSQPLGTRLSIARLAGGMAGMLAVIVACFVPPKLGRHAALLVGAALMTWAWVYFQFRVSEGAGGLTCGMSLPFLTFVAAAAYRARRLWWLW
jgi:hypothetical protein